MDRRHALRTEKTLLNFTSMTHRFKNIEIHKQKQCTEQGKKNNNNFPFGQFYHRKFVRLFKYQNALNFLRRFERTSSVKKTHE